MVSYVKSGSVKGMGGASATAGAIKRAQERPSVLSPTSRATSGGGLASPATPQTGIERGEPVSTIIQNQAVVQAVTQVTQPRGALIDQILAKQTSDLTSQRAIYVSKGIPQPSIKTPAGAAIQSALPAGTQIQQTYMNGDKKPYAILPSGFLEQPIKYDKTTVGNITKPTYQSGKDTMISNIALQRTPAPKYEEKMPLIDKAIQRLNKSVVPKIASDILDVQIGIGQKMQERGYKVTGKTLELSGISARSFSEILTPVNALTFGLEGAGYNLLKEVGIRGAAKTMQFATLGKVTPLTMAESMVGRSILRGTGIGLDVSFGGMYIGQKFYEPDVVTTTTTKQLPDVVETKTSVSKMPEFERTTTFTTTTSQSETTSSSKSYMPIPFISKLKSDKEIAKSIGEIPLEIGAFIKGAEIESSLRSSFGKFYPSHYDILIQEKARISERLTGTVSFPKVSEFLVEYFPKLKEMKWTNPMTGEPAFKRGTTIAAEERITAPEAERLNAMLEFRAEAHKTKLEIKPEFSIKHIVPEGLTPQQSKVIIRETKKGTLFGGGSEALRLETAKPENKFRAKDLDVSFFNTAKATANILGETKGTMAKTGGEIPLNQYAIYAGNKGYKVKLTGEQLERVYQESLLKAKSQKGWTLSQANKSPIYTDSFFGKVMDVVPSGRFEPYPYRQRDLPIKRGGKATSLREELARGISGTLEMRAEGKDVTKVQRIARALVVEAERESRNPITKNMLERLMPESRLKYQRQETLRKLQEHLGKFDSGDLAKDFPSFKEQIKGLEGGKTKAGEFGEAPKGKVAEPARTKTDFGYKFETPQTSIFRPPEFSKVSGFYSKPSVISNVSRISGTSTISETSKTSKISNISQISKISDISQISGTSRISRISDISRTSQFSSFSQTSKFDNWTTTGTGITAALPPSLGGIDPTRLFGGGKGGQRKSVTPSLLGQELRMRGFKIKAPSAKRIYTGLEIR